MLARLDYENLIQVNQAEVSEQVGMNRHNVNRSIKKLIELGVILEGVKIGISRSYRLNPNFGWKGSAKAIGGSARARRLSSDKGAQGAWGSFSAPSFGWFLTKEMERGQGMKCCIPHVCRISQHSP